MSDTNHYIIAGGEPGAERLHVLARAIRPGTLEALRRAGLGAGMSVLDVGCGPGDVTLEIARVVGSSGRVVGIDMDAAVLTHGRVAAEKAGLAVEWRCQDVEDFDEPGAYDLVYARFLLSHLVDPAAMLDHLLGALRPGGRIVIEDIDISAHTCWPASSAFARYVELYEATARAHGVDATIGPRLPGLLLDAGATELHVNLSTPVFLAGEGKHVACLTLQSIAGSAVESGLTTAAEISELLDALHRHEADPRSLQSIAQICQVTGRKPLRSAMPTA